MTTSDQTRVYMGQLILDVVQEGQAHLHDDPPSSHQESLEYMWRLAVQGGLQASRRLCAISPMYVYTIYTVYIDICAYVCMYILSISALLHVTC